MVERSSVLVWNFRKKWFGISGKNDFDKLIRRCYYVKGLIEKSV